MLKPSINLDYRARYGLPVFQLVLMYKAYVGLLLIQTNLTFRKVRMFLREQKFKRLKVQFSLNLTLIYFMNT